MALVERYHWSLYDIDRTHIESLIPFVIHASKPKPGNDAPAGNSRFVYADQVDFL